MCTVTSTYAIEDLLETGARGALVAERERVVDRASIGLCQRLTQILECRFQSTRLQRQWLEGHQRHGSRVRVLLSAKRERQRNDDGEERERQPDIRAATRHVEPHRVP